MPMYMDSPGYPVTTKNNAIKVVVPNYRMNNKTDFSYDGVTAFMKVNTSDEDLPMLGVYEVFSLASAHLSLPYKVKNNKMEISVLDTYVKREDDNTMHFDILVPSDVTDEQIIFSFGMDYLKTKPFQTNQVSANECRLCHIEEATDAIITDIEKNGYSIIEMENCH